jgi:hypothetical protein
MNKEQAIKIMKQMAQSVRGTLEEHKVIQAAISYLSELEEKKVEAPK